MTISRHTPLIKKISETYSILARELKAYITSTPDLMTAAVNTHNAERNDNGGEENLGKWLDRFVDRMLYNSCLTISREYGAGENNEEELYGDFNGHLARAAVRITLMGQPEIYDEIRNTIRQDCGCSAQFIVEDGCEHIIVRIWGQNGDVGGELPKLRSLLRNFGYGEVDTDELGRTRDGGTVEYTTFGCKHLSYLLG